VKIFDNTNGALGSNSLVVNTESMGHIVSNSMVNWYVIFVLTTKFLGNNYVRALTIYRINPLVKTMCLGAVQVSELRGAKGKTESA
jgi:hypothetical protein